MNLFDSNKAYSNYYKEGVLLLNLLREYLKMCDKKADGNILSFLDLINNLETVSQSCDFWLKHATPFFILELHECILSNENYSDKTLFSVFFLFLDAYFILFSPFKLIVNSPSEQIVSLPKLGVNITLKVGENQIEKLNHEELVINGQMVIRNKIALFMGYDDAMFLCGSKKDYQRLFSRVNQAFLLPINDCQTDNILEQDLAKLRGAFAIIFEVDKKLYQEINGLIKFYVPLQATQHGSSSFSLRPYIGISFLSFNTDVLAVMENVIREYANNLISILIKYNSFSNQTEECYYSPYQDKPSSGSHLLSYVFIFSIVIDFYSQFLLNNHLGYVHDVINYRMNVQINRFLLALRQIKKINWSDEALILLGEVEANFLRVKNANRHNLLSIPDVIYHQLSNWKIENPGLLKNVGLFDGFVRETI